MVTESSLMVSIVSLITPDREVSRDGGGFVVGNGTAEAPESLVVVVGVAGVAKLSHPENVIWLAASSRRYAKVVLWPLGAFVIS